MRKIRQIITGGLLAAGFVAALLPAPATQAINVFDQCASNPGAAVCKSKGDDATNMIQVVLNILLYVLGIISVVMIVIGGIRFTTSNGDPAGTKTARMTIIYSVVGLVVAILSYAIVNLVVGKFVTG